MREKKNVPFYGRISDFVPSISLDCVVFGYQNGALHILLLKFNKTDSWALPGGFLPKEVEMQEAVSGILFERTGISDIFLTQYHTFSSTRRGWQDNESDKESFDKVKTMWPEEHKEKLISWFDQRFISTAFMALVDASIVKLEPDEFSDDCRWIPLNELPSLVLDHRAMIEEAKKHLKQRINFLPIGRSLLPERFTMADLQALYEAILEQKMDRGNFQRKIMKLGILNRHEKLMTGASNKAPYLYSINDEVYDRLVNEGIGFS